MCGIFKTTSRRLYIYFKILLCVELCMRENDASQQATTTKIVVGTKGVFFIFLFVFEERKRAYIYFLFVRAWKDKKVPYIYVVHTKGRTQKNEILINT